MKTKTYAVPEGCKITSVDLKNRIIVYEVESEEPETPEFKKGDFVFCEDEGDYCIAILSADYVTNEFDYHARFNKKLNTANFDGASVWSITRHATPEEKQLLLDKIREVGKDWDEDKMGVVDWAWKPKEGEKFYCVNNIEIDSYNWDNYTFGSKLYELGNCFKTQELAEIALEERTKLFKTLKHA
jgi:hypothetical protein